jgi:hypothetical protein
MYICDADRRESFQEAFYKFERRGGDSLSLVCLCCEQIRDQQAISPTEENVLIKIKAMRAASWKI